MKAKIGLALGTGIGTIIYQLFRHGESDIDWYRVGFVTLFTGIVLLILPSHLFEKKEARK